jgi:toxin ParE1/3/4
VKIRWTAVAADDLKSVHEYLSERAPTRPDTIVDRILAGIDVLEQYPNLGRQGRLDGTRELVITGTPFIVFYRLAKSKFLGSSTPHASGLTPSEARISCLGGK